MHQSVYLLFFSSLLLNHFHSIACHLRCCTLCTQCIDGWLVGWLLASPAIVFMSVDKCSTKCQSFTFFVFIYIRINQTLCVQRSENREIAAAPHAQFHLNNIDWRTCFTKSNSRLKGKLMELWILFMMFIILLKFYRPLCFFSR